ncbi:MAG: glycosyltransferase, partial [Candidatus Omnitrophota bacterium]
MMQKIPLSVVILTRNEEKNISECIDSVKDWVGEIVVVDDYSCDKTIDIVRQHTDKIHQRKWEMEGPQRNFAYSKAHYDYI